MLATNGGKRNSATFLRCNGRTRVAVHIRRGDVNGHGGEAFRYTSNLDTLRVMCGVTQDWWEKTPSPLCFHTYSEGAAEKLEEI